MKTFEELEQDALSRNIPVMQKEGIDFLIQKLNEIHAKSCLEIGSAIGYSSMMMATFVEGLHIDTIELNEERYQEAVCNIHERQLEHMISIYNDDALTFDKQKLKYYPYDCLFIDAAKAQYQKFKAEYDQIVAQEQPKIDELKKQLQALSKKVEPSTMELYNKKRADKIFPVFVQLMGNNCGRCRMELSASALSKLKNEHVLSCENCRSIIYEN